MMKNIFFTVLLMVFLQAHGQTGNWQNKDLQKDGIFGISTDKAYAELLKNKTAATVIVTIIDSGIDTLHEDLKQAIWRNPNELPANGRDDDHNGYPDDVLGWNFTGLSLKRDSLVKLIQSKKAFYDSLEYTKVPDDQRAGFELFNKRKREFEHISGKLKQFFADLTNSEKIISSLAAGTGKDNPSVSDFKALLVRDTSKKKMIRQIIGLLPLYKDYKAFRSGAITACLKKLSYAIEHLETGKDSCGIISALVDNNNNIGYDQEFILPKDEDIFSYEPITFHGTHIAGIIAADRTNHIGIDGIANHVRLMNLKIYSGLFPAFREESLAKAIRYAADNGSRIINLSLRATDVSDKSVLENAIRYAMKKHVLIVRAAGNEGENVDNLPGRGLYPSKYYADGGEAAAWLTVGASGWKDNDSLAARFSNYGARGVDVFAPGVHIESAVPGNRYLPFNGTSMSTPMVVGLAALIMEYYPDLTAEQVKEIIMRSVQKPEHDVLLPGQNAAGTRVPFSSLCVSGGIINAYKALKLASTYRPIRHE